MNLGPQVELPQYKSHKVVRAAKVTAMQKDNPEGMPEGWEPTTTLFLGEIAATVTVKDSWIQRSGCDVGGYFVRYEDGFTSWSPAKAFEEGYTST